MVENEFCIYHANESTCRQMSVVDDAKTDMCYYCNNCQNQNVDIT